MKVYLAGPFFNDKQIEYIEKAENILRNKGFDLFSPRDHTIENGDMLPNNIWGKEVFKMDISAIDSCDLVVAIYSGMYSDTGTAMEIGYAYAKGKDILIVCTDLEDEQSLMIINSSKAILRDIDSLSTFNFSEMITDVIIKNQK